MLKQIQFRLRSLFLLVAGAAVVSELCRLILGGNSPFLIGFACFAYGAIGAVSVCTIITVMSVIVARSPTAHRVGSVVAMLVSTVGWLGVVSAPAMATELSLPISWFPICGFYSMLVVTLMLVFARYQLAADDEVLPERPLKRLRKAKVDLS